MSGEGEVGGGSMRRQLLKVERNGRVIDKFDLEWWRI